MTKCRECFRGSVTDGTGEPTDTPAKTAPSSGRLLRRLQVPVALVRLRTLLRGTRGRADSAPRPGLEIPPQPSIPALPIPDLPDIGLFGPRSPRSSISPSLPLFPTPIHSAGLFGPRSARSSADTLNSIDNEMRMNNTLDLAKDDALGVDENQPLAGALENKEYNGLLYQHHPTISRK